MHTTQGRERDGEADRTFECDDCGDVYSDFGSFTDVWEEAKADGWKARKDGIGWCHYCPACAGDH